MFDRFRLKNIRIGAGDSLVGEVYENVHGWDVKVGEIELKPAGRGDFTPVGKPYLTYPISYSQDPAGNIHISFTSLTPAKIIDDIEKTKIIDDILKEPFRDLLQNNALDKKKLFRL